MEPTYIETSYERGTKPKVLSKIPLVDEWMPRLPDQALAAFDGLFAVDTNSRGGRAATALIVGRKTRHPDDGAPAIALEQQIRAVYFEGARKGEEERIGWELAFRMIVPGKGQTPGRLGLIVDHDLGRLDAYNERREPIVGARKLPTAFTLIYASSDATDNVANEMIRIADSTASRILRHYQEYDDDLEPISGLEIRGRPIVITARFVGPPR